MQDSIYTYVDQMISVFGSVYGLIGIGFGLLLLLMLGTIPKARWWILTLLIFTSTFDVGGDGTSTLAENRQFPFPMDLFRQNVRVLEILVATLLLIPLVLSVKGWRRRLVPAPMAFFLLLEIWICMRLLPENAFRLRAILSLVTFTLLFLTLVLGIGRSLQTIEDGYAFVKSIAAVGVVFVLANIYYVIRTPSSASGRYWGTTSNPQMVGQTVALLLPPLLCMAQLSTSRITRKIGLWVVVGFLGIFLLWSGSRGGVLMTLAGIAVFYRIQLRRLIVGGLLLGATVVLASLIFPQSLVSISRFTDASNSRAGPWHDLFQMFLQNPISGTTFQGQGYGEGFYLATLANYGLIGGIPMALFVIFLLSNMGWIFRKRRLLGSHSVLADVVLAEMAMVLVSGVFESSLLGIWNIVTLLLYLHLAFLGFLKDSISAVEVGAVEHVETPQLAFGMPMPQV